MAVTACRSSSYLVPISREQAGRLFCCLNLPCCKQRLDSHAVGVAVRQVSAPGGICCYCSTCQVTCQVSSKRDTTAAGPVSQQPTALHNKANGLPGCHMIQQQTLSCLTRGSIKADIPAAEANTLG